MNPIAVSFLIMLGTLSLVSYFLYLTTKSRGIGANRLFGLKTRQTLRSDDAWQAGHSAAQPAVLAAAVAGVLTIATTVAIALLMPGSEAVTTVLAVTGVFSLLGLLGYGTRLANRAARRVC